MQKEGKDVTHRQRAVTVSGLLDWLKGSTIGLRRTFICHAPHVENTSLLFLASPSEGVNEGNIVVIHTIHPN